MCSILRTEPHGSSGLLTGIPSAPTCLPGKPLRIFWAVITTNCRRKPCSPSTRGSDPLRRGEVSLLWGAEAGSLPHGCRHSCPNASRSGGFCSCKARCFRGACPQNPPALMPQARPWPAQHLSSVSAHKRYNTLHFACKVVCHETAGFFGFFLLYRGGAPGENDLIHTR